MKIVFRFPTGYLISAMVLIVLVWMFFWRAY
jgi:hypothetical protein